MKFHELANIFPMLEGEDINKLADDIKVNGLRDAIVLLDGKILDGRNRYAACVIAKVKPRYVKFKGGDPFAFILSENLHRRHLNESQRAMIAAKLANMERTDTLVHKISGGGYRCANLRNDKISQPHAAEMLNVSRRLVQDAVEIKNDGDAETIAAIESGEMTVNEAKKKAKAQRKTEERRALLESLPVAPTADGYEPNSISVCAVKDIRLPENTIDMIFTDPPYHDEHLDCYFDLARLAAKVLKPGAMLFTYCGNMFLPDVVAALGSELEYVWTMAVFHSFSKTKISKHNLFENWRPILAYRKAGKTATREWVQDVVRGTRDKSAHEWQQDEDAPRQYIAAYTQPGEIVLDPFVGGGTTPKVCKELKRVYVCFDIDPDAVKISLNRTGG